MGYAQEIARDLTYIERRADEAVARLNDAKAELATLAPVLAQQKAETAAECGAMRTDAKLSADATMAAADAVKAEADRLMAEIEDKMKTAKDEIATMKLKALRETERIREGARELRRAAAITS